MQRLLAVALLVAGAAHARDLRPEILVEGRVEAITVSPAGQLWIANATGNVYRSDDGGRTWWEPTLPAVRVGDDWLDRVSFFDEKRAMLTGSIGELSDRFLLTADAGATWEEASLPVDGLLVYDAQATGDGHAWIVGSGGMLLGSDDFGRTWRELAPPFDEIRRTYRVWFDTPDLGVVGSVGTGEVVITRDGGASWQKFDARGRGDILRGCGEKDVTKTRIQDGRVIITQCGGVFSSPIEPPRAWTRVVAAGKPLIDFELGDQGQLIGITAGRDVYAGDRPLGMRLEHPLLAMAANARHIALIDSELKVAAFDGDAWHASRMLGKGVATSWPIQTIDRGPDDVLWGVSQHFLYRSEDGATTWDRIAEVPAAVDRVLIQTDGNVLLSDGHGWVGRWDVAAQQLVDVPGLNGLDVAGAFRRSDVWLVWGGRQSGFVAASVDGGRTWRVVDVWKDEDPQILFLSDDNRLTLLSRLCGIRQGTLSLEPLGANMRTLIPGSDRKRTPYAEHVSALDLLRGDEGWIAGVNNQTDNLVYHTTDGGRSWKRVDVSAYAPGVIDRLFDGTWIGYIPLSTLQRWNGKTFETLTTTLPDYVSGIWIDSQGSYLIRFEGGSVSVLDPEHGTLRNVGRASARPTSH